MNDTAMRRLFVSPLPLKNEDIRNDLRQFFSKVAVVEDVYVPAPTITGIIRNFAIICIRANDDILKKSLKVFNGTFFHGVKIHVELSNKEYFKDRLAKEALSLAVEEPKTIESTVGSFVSSTVKLRKKTGDTALLEVSTIPTYLSSVKSKANELSCHRLLFDEDGEAPNYDYYKEDETKQLCTPLRGVRKGFGNILNENFSENILDPSPLSSSAKFNTNLCCGAYEGTESIPDSDQDVEDPQSPVHVNDIESIKLDFTAELRRALDILAQLNNPIIDAEYQNKLVNKSVNPIVLRYDPRKYSTSQRELKIADILSEREITEKAVVSNRDQFANLSTLKEIFHKEGGVWFGDDGTLQEQIKRGNSAFDNMFLEAEKFGFDIRENLDKSKKEMKFCFFELEKSEMLNDSNNISEPFNCIEEPADIISYKVECLRRALELEHIQELASKFSRDRDRTDNDLREEWKGNNRTFLDSIKLKRRQSIKHLDTKRMRI